MDKLKTGPIGLGLTLGLDTIRSIGYTLNARMVLRCRQDT